MSWLNSMQPKINKTCILLTSSREIYKVDTQTYLIIGLAIQKFKLERQRNSTKQGLSTFMEYYNTLKGLWLQVKM